MNSSIEGDSHRTFAAGVLGHREIPVPRTAIVTAYLLLFSASILLFLPIDTLAWLAEEDGPIENAGAICFLLASAIFFVTAYRSSGSHRQYGANYIGSPLALYALGALLIVCFGEEISWGQRLFHYSVPSWLEAINQQGEWNLHNLTWFQAHTTDGVKKSFWARSIDMNRLLALFQLALCTLVPVLTAYATTFRTLAERMGIPVVPWWIAGLAPLHFLVSQALYMIVGGGAGLILGDALDETKETIRAFIFLVVAIWTYRQTTATPTVSAGKRPLDAVGA